MNAFCKIVHTITPYIIKVDCNFIPLMLKVLSVDREHGEVAIFSLTSTNTSWLESTELTL